MAIYNYCIQKMVNREAHGWLRQIMGLPFVLLNGAFIKHEPKPPYAKSRGLVLLDFFHYNNVELFLNNYDFLGIEPFTLLIFSDQAAISEIRWDGLTTHFKSLDATSAHIWSSATLYSSEIVKAREEAFYSFIESKNSILAKDLIEFHHFDGIDSPLTAIKMLPNNGTQTLSVTCISRTGTMAMMNYANLADKTEHTFELICH
ncbi:MAG: hypothetical protein SGJ00_07490 [bacterium]|nr:hypothetical protein [bacterium]